MKNNIKENEIVSNLKELLTKLINYLKSHLGIVGSIIAICILLLLFSNLFFNAKRKALVFAEKYYKEVHELYFYGQGIDYELDSEGNIVNFKNENGMYYKISNYDYFKKLFSNSKLKEVNKYFDIQEVNKEYFMKDFGRGLGNYYGTTFKIKSLTNKKKVYTAKSKFCEVEYITNYGSGCSEDHFYTIDKTFTLVKEDGIWKIDKYTSVFEFTDEEFK